MQKILNTILKRKVSTKIVDDKPSMIASSALDNRVHRMLALQATQPLPQRAHFAQLSNPTQSVAVS